MSKCLYTGRFAPSPSGSLHFGSLVTALASYLDARQQGGKWLVRIEDLDPPREKPGAVDRILKALDTYGLHWDDQVIMQSRCTDIYQEALEKLKKQNALCFCVCTRKNLKKNNGICTGQCYASSITPEVPYSLRLHCPDKRVGFTDRVYGKQSFSLRQKGNCVLVRKDKLHAYQLAVVIDDSRQGVTHVVRGADLLNTTPWQIHLLEILGQPVPSYAHIPLVLDDRGNKLSKEHRAGAIPLDNPAPVLLRALKTLGLKPAEITEKASVDNILQWAIVNWQFFPHKNRT